MRELTIIQRAAAASREKRSGPGAPTPYTDSQSREEMRAFLQKRLRQFGGLLALLFGMFFTWRLVASFVGDQSPNRVYLLPQAVAVSTFAGIWFVCRGRPRSIGFLRALEFGGLCVAGGAAIAMTLRISYLAHPDTVLLLCLTYTLITRSIIVPSSAERTFWYGVFFAVPFLIAVFLIHYLKFDPSIYNANADPRYQTTPSTMGMRWSIVGGLWWVASLLITTATSRVIYGLRQEVRDARKLGQYTLTEKLGQGGMGVVYRAKHAMLRRPSAIKLLPPDRFGDEAVTRFEREVQLTAGLSHPNTIRVYDYGRTPDGIFYYVMEYLEGASLDEIVSIAGPLPPGRVIHILDQVAGALSEAHVVALIHRDIKPANIFLTQQGGVPDVAKVLDFGLVKRVNRSSGEETTLQQLTNDDSFSGTPLYMAPEAITTPEQLDARTDIYSLGAVGYFLLTGQDVFGGRNLVEVCSHHLHSVPPPPSTRIDTPISEDLEAVILACLEKSPEKRPVDARTLQSALRACRDARSWSEDDARRWFAVHAQQLQDRQSRAEVGGAATVAVDLGLRANLSEVAEKKAG